jgi:hypothetical protein
MDTPAATGRLISSVGARRLGLATALAVCGLGLVWWLLRATPPSGPAHGPQRATSVAPVAPIVLDAALPSEDAVTRREAGAVVLPAGRGPSVADALRVLSAFGWTSEELHSRFPAARIQASRELLDTLLTRAPRDEDLDDIEELLSCLAGVGLADDAAAERLRDWAAGPNARQLTRKVSKLLIESGSRGRELAAGLALDHWRLSLNDRKDRVAQLSASYMVQELGRARVGEALPVLSEIATQALSRAQEIAAELSGQLAAPIQALPKDPAKARAIWDQDPRSEGLKEMWEWRNRARTAMEALVAIDDEASAAWIGAQLDGASQTPTLALEVACEALRRALPDHSVGPTARRLQPWILERLESSTGLANPTEREFVLRFAGVCGEPAVGALVTAVSTGGNSAALLGLADAMRRSSTPEGLAALGAALEPAQALEGDPEQALAAQLAALEVVVEFGDDAARARVHGFVASASAAQAAGLLEALPDSFWRTNPAGLADLIGRMESELATNGDATVVVDRAIQRLLAADIDIAQKLQGFAGSTEPRLADKCRDAVFMHAYEHATSATERLRLLETEFQSSPNPWRNLLATPSLWERAVQFGSEPESGNGLVADALGASAKPLGLRLALARALALRGSRQALDTLEARAPALAVAAAEACRSGEDWSRNFELAHWKSLAWLAVGEPIGQRIARGALAAVLKEGRDRLSAHLLERLPVLEQYLAACERAGWVAADARLAEIGAEWGSSTGPAAAEAALALRQLALDSGLEWLRTRSAAASIPDAARLELCLELAHRVDAGPAEAAPLIAQLLEQAWLSPERGGFEAALQRISTAANCALALRDWLAVAWRAPERTQFLPALARVERVLEPARGAARSE